MTHVSVELRPYGQFAAKRPAAEQFCQCAGDAVANFLSPKGQRD
jgi:hypothetical protein